MAGADTVLSAAQRISGFRARSRRRRRGHLVAHVDSLPVLALESGRARDPDPARCGARSRPRAATIFSSSSTSAMPSSTTTTPPPGALDVLAALDSSERWLDNVLVLHSLSKRSSAAGLRSGFAAGDREALAALNRVRLNGTACTPLPLARRGDGALVGGRPRRGDARAAQGNARTWPTGCWAGSRDITARPCGFFLWLEADDGVALTQRLWRDFALQGAPRRVSHPTRCGRHQRGARFRPDRPRPRPRYHPGGAGAPRRSAGPVRAARAARVTKRAPSLSPSAGSGLKLAPRDVISSRTSGLFPGEGT